MIFTSLREADGGTLWQAATIVYSGHVCWILCVKIVSHKLGFEVVLLTVNPLFLHVSSTSLLKTIGKRRNCS